VLDNELSLPHPRCLGSRQPRAGAGRLERRCARNALPVGNRRCWSSRAALLPQRAERSCCRFLPWFSAQQKGAMNQFVCAQTSKNLDCVRSKNDSCRAGAFFCCRAHVGYADPVALSTAAPGDAAVGGGAAMQVLIWTAKNRDGLVI